MFLGNTLLNPLKLILLWLVSYDHLPRGREGRLLEGETDSEYEIEYYDQY